MCDDDKAKHTIYACMHEGLNAGPYYMLSRGKQICKSPPTSLGI